MRKKRDTLLKYKISLQSLVCQKNKEMLRKGCGHVVRTQAPTWKKKQPTAKARSVSATEITILLDYGTKETLCIHADRIYSWMNK